MANDLMLLDISSEEEVPMGYETQEDTTIDTPVGTSYKGTIKTDYHKLVELFGKPETVGGEEDKTEMMWLISFDDGMSATVYDRFAPDVYTNENWSVGSKYRSGLFRLDSILQGEEIFYRKS